MNVFVTGANGYLGGHVIAQLAERGHNVYGEDSHRRLVFGTGDRRQRLKKAEAIVHLAWYSSAGGDEEGLHHYCYRRTMDLVDAVKDNPLRKFVFSSTAAVYGDGGDQQFEEIDPLKPNCHYGQFKAWAEDRIRKQIKKHMILRLGSLMGKGITRTKTQLVVNSMAVDAYLRGKMQVWNPQAWKPVLHVRDAALMVVLAAEFDDWIGTVNVCEDSYRAVEIARLVSWVTGAKLEVIPSPAPPKSCILSRERLVNWSNLTFKDVVETIPEFKGFKESKSDKNHPWSDVSPYIP